MTPPTAAAQLPIAVLARILQRVPQQQRLSACALVCNAWAAAAAAATHSITTEVSRTDLNVVPSFEAWLQHHDSLDVRGRWSKLELPCAALVQLTSLSLESCEVRTFQQPEQEQQHGAQAALPQLVSLRLVSCKLSSSTAFQLLAASPGLTALDLQRVYWEVEAPQQQQTPVADTPCSPTLTAVLQACSRLQVLHLEFWSSTMYYSDRCMPPASLSALSGLSQLHDLSLQNLPPSSTAALPALPTRLTRLCIEGHCWHQQLPDQARDLSMLQILHLQGVAYKPQFLTGLMQQLKLRIEDAHVEDAQGDALAPAAAPTQRRFVAILAAVAGLTQLQDLSLSTNGEAVLPALPTNLTRLCLDGEVSLPDQAWDRTRLHALALEGGASFPPRILFGMTQLQRLKLHIPCEQGQGLLRTAADPQPPFTTLLAAVGGLSQLQELYLHVCDADLDGTELQPQAFACLTASSQLQVLHLLSFEITEPYGGSYILGSDELQHMFPDGRRLAQLHTLVLGASNHNYSWGIAGADLPRIAASCPSLDTLSISHMLDARANLTPLLQFTTCRSLCVGGAVFNDRAAVLVAQLTQLTSLEWECTRDADLTIAGLMQLTALTQLQQLKCTPPLKGQDPYHHRLHIERALSRNLPMQLATSVQVSSPKLVSRS